ncbi:hypothetical protein NDK43_20005 [Neobacillus pocheonensis]|uniref:Uncharacterized protein n=1 Tax=Neobacillus pocheonensis TaxID=363869 RepID=A0ABT0WGN5_9BACI|nr:hypothetical protein [Neobacillus pocheonensis]
MYHHLHVFHRARDAGIDDFKEAEKESAKITCTSQKRHLLWKILFGRG